MFKRARSLEDRVSSVLLLEQEKNLNFYETEFTVLLDNYNSFLKEVIQIWQFRRSVLTLVLNSKFSAFFQIDLFVLLIFLDFYLASLVGETNGIVAMLSLLDTKIMYLKIWNFRDKEK